jgi:membrane associated rhomboid family serine protease
MPRRTPATTLLIVVNVLAFLYEIAQAGSGLVLGGGSLAGLTSAGALIPVLVRQGEYWRLITGAFLHGSILHLAVNMYSLYVLGRFIEALAGTRRMAVVYAVSLVVSSLAVVIFSGPFEVTVGASGAIFGLFGALFAFGFKLGRPGMRLVQANLGILVLNLIFTFAVPGISASAHVGGLIAGFIVGALVYTPPRPSQAWEA